MTVALTSLSHGAGYGCKFPAAAIGSPLALNLYPDEVITNSGGRPGDALVLTGWGATR